jgi:hypothetical protein
MKSGEYSMRNRQSVIRIDSFCRENNSLCFLQASSSPEQPRTSFESKAPSANIKLTYKVVDALEHAWDHIFAGGAGGKRLKPHPQARRFL